MSIQQPEKIEEDISSPKESELSETMKLSQVEKRKVNPKQKDIIKLSKDEITFARNL